VIARGILPTEAAALVEFFRGCGAPCTWFEEGTQAQWLHDLLSPWWIGSWSATGGASETGNKGDQAMPTSSRTGCARRPAAVYHGSSDRRHAAGADAHVPQRRRGLDAGDAPAQGALPGARDPCLRHARLRARSTGQSGSPSWPTAECASGPRRSTRSSTCCGAATEGEGGHDRRGAPRSGVGGAALIPFSVRSGWRCSWPR
jgi:hypothetical protein